jgi:hypothetical protein
MDKKYMVHIELTNEFGIFVGKSVVLDGESLEKLKVISKTFYIGGGFELTIEDGSLLIFSPELVSKSFLKIYSKEYNL